MPCAQLFRQRQIVHPAFAAASADGYDRQVRTEDEQRADRFQSLLVWQEEVRDDDIDDLVPERPQTGSAVAGLDDLITFLLQRKANEPAHLLVMVNNQNAWHGILLPDCRQR